MFAAGNDFTFVNAEAHYYEIENITSIISSHKKG